MRDGVSYCFPLDKKYNCKKIFNPALQDGNFVCEECEEESFYFSPLVKEHASAQCMMFDFVEGCVKYDNNLASIADSTFICVECDRHTYFDDG